MFKGLIDDLKDSTGHSLRMTSLVALSGFAGFIALGFVSAAIFIAVQQRYSAIEACLSVAGIFIIVAVVIALIYANKKRRLRMRAQAAARSAARAAANAPMIDPAMLATGIQIARTIGLKKLIPLLALAGVAIGYISSRGGAGGDDESPNDESD